MTKLFRGETERGPAEDKRKVFFLLSGAAVGKRSMSSGFPLRAVPRLPYTGAVRPWLGLYENIKPVRISTTLQESTPTSEPQSRPHAVEDVSPSSPRRPYRREFRLYAVYYTAGVCRRCRNNDAFHVLPATKVFAVRPPVSSTYLTRVRFAVSSSLSSSEETLKFDRTPTFI